MRKPAKSFCFLSFHPSRSIQNTTEQSALEFRHISLSFGQNRVFQDFSLHIAAGERWCIMGKSGNGKSTLFNLLLGFVKPDSGYVTDTTNLRKGVVFQEDRLIEHLDATANVLLTAAPSVTSDDIHSALTSVHLDETQSNKPVKNMSGGQRRRVAIVRAILSKPELLILDEPFKGLDDQTRNATGQFIMNNLPSGCTVLLSTHDSTEGTLLQTNRFLTM